MPEVNSISDIQTLLKQGFTAWRDLGAVSVAELGDLRLFNYTAQAQYEARWNYFERVSRGLILNAKSGEVVARPFDKFFNWGEADRYSTAPIVNVTEKLDGSLGILYRHQGGYQIATRGNFESEQAAWATAWLQRTANLNSIPDNLTFLFEIIYPENRVVIDYRGFASLVLLDIRDRFSGQYRRPYQTVLDAAAHYGFASPKLYHFSTTADIIAVLDDLSQNEEGYVAEFADGQRFKFKGSEYRTLHKHISNLSFKHTLESIASGSLDDLRALVPDEFLGEVNLWEAEIRQIVAATKQEIERVFAQAPKDSRKDFALWVMANHQSLSSYMFAKLDGKPLEPLIYKLAFDEALKQHAA